MPFDLSISLQGSTILFVLLVIVGITIVYFYYKYTIPPLPSSKKILLTILRLLAVLLLLTLFYEPVVDIIHRNDQPPLLAVLLDNSQSMAMTDASGNRSFHVHSWLDKNNIQPVSSLADVRFYTFSSRLDSNGNHRIDSLSFKGESTNLSEVIGQLRERITKENIQAAILVTDGNYNVGKNPLYEAEGLGIPIFTIGVGDTTEQKDVLVEKVLTNSIAYANNRLPVEVSIKSSGYRDETVEVTVAEGGNVLDRSTLKLSEGTRSYPVKLSITPGSEGVHKYTVRVSSLKGELTEKNNIRLFFVKVLKDKIRIVVFAGAPNTDVTAVRKVFAEDERFTTQVFVQKSSNEFYEANYNRSTLDSADCFVLINFPSQATSQQSLSDIADAVNRLKKPMLFIHGKSIDHRKLQQLEPFLPFSWISVNNGEVSVLASVNDRQKNHPLINLEGEVTAETWQQIPPIVKSQTSFKSKPEAEVLASVKIQNIVLPEPLITIRNINRQKSFAVTGYNIWQWRLMAQGNPQTENFLSLLLSNAVRWLTTLEEGKNVRIVPTKEMYTTAEPVQFTAQVYNQQLRPVDNAEVTVDIQRGKEAISATLTSVGNGLYEGSVEGLGEGDFTYNGKATLDGTKVGEDNGRFTVGQLNLEFLETKMNKQLLEQMAFRTGGKFYMITDSENLSNDIRASVKFSAKEIVQKTEIELWNWQYTLGTLVLLFGIEWFIRKRSGML
jgi:hypothetical protein